MRVVTWNSVTVAFLGNEEIHYRGGKKHRSRLFINGLKHSLNTQVNCSQIACQWLLRATLITNHNNFLKNGLQVYQQLVHTLRTWTQFLIAALPSVKTDTLLDFLKWCNRARNATLFQEEAQLMIAGKTVFFLQQQELRRNYGHVFFLDNTSKIPPN